MTVEQETARILLIEDQDLDARIVELALLRPVEDAFELQRCETLTEGLERARVFQPELLLLDLSLPDAEGVEAVQKLQNAFPQIPIIVLTGSKDPQLAMDALENGAEDFVQKDEFQKKHFRRSIKYALERNQTKMRMLEMERQMQEMLRLQSLSTLAGGIAHDFNNALTTVMGNISVILEKVLRDDEELADPLRDAQNSLYRAKHLSHQLLALSQKDHLELKVLAPENLVENTLKFLKSSERVEMTVEKAPNLPRIRADEYKVINVLHNVLTNALEAIKYRGQISIELGHVRSPEDGNLPDLDEGDYLVFSVTDSGNGVSADALERVWDAYYSTKGPGRGAGLANAQAIVRMHEGVMTVENAPNAGACFRVYLPAAGAPAENAPQRSSEARQGSGHILLMDDDEAVQKSVGFMLKRLGYTVDTAADGEEGLKLFKSSLQGGDGQSAYDAMILDLTVPGGMGGREMIQAVREIDQDVPAIVSSGYSDDDVLINFTSYGFHAKLPKPFTVGELSEAVETVLAAGD